MNRKKIVGLSIMALSVSMLAGCKKPDVKKAEVESKETQQETVNYSEAESESCEESIETQTQETLTQTAETQQNTELYRTQADGSPAQGWVTDADGTRGYCCDGVLATGFMDIDQARYYFDDNGNMVTGKYVDKEGKTRLFTEDGRQYLNSAAKMDGYTYYFDENGEIVTGSIVFPDGTNGMTDDEGHLYTGCHLIGNEVYDFTSAGKLRHKVSADRPMVALTYDDGPSTKNTQVILDTLKAYNAYATFFVVGRSVNNNQDIITAIEASGSEIGNHTYNHYLVTNMDAAVTFQEISATSSYVQMITGNRPSIMRPPTGSVNDVSCANVAAVDDGYPLILWSIDTLDWQHKNSDITCQRIRDNVRDGSIILMHDMQSSSAVASQIIIPELTAMGYELVTVSELAAARGGMIPGHVYNHFYPEDTAAAANQ